MPLLDIPFFHAPSSKEIWLELRIPQEDFARLALSRKQLLAECRASGAFREVQGGLTTPSSQAMVRLELITTVTYASRPSDKVADLVLQLRPFIWASATTVAPYRRYYLYASMPRLLLNTRRYFPSWVTSARSHVIGHNTSGRF